MHVVIVYSAIVSTASKTISSQELNEASHTHQYLLHCSAVQSLKVIKDALVFFSS